MKSTCPNPKDPKFKELVDATNEKIAYNLWSLNNGYPLDFTKEGKESELFKELLNRFNGDRRKAIIAKAKMFTLEYNNYLEEELLSALKNNNNIPRLIDQLYDSLKQQVTLSDNFSSIENKTINIYAGTGKNADLSNVDSKEEATSKPAQLISITEKNYKKYSQYIKLSSDTKLDLDDTVKEKIQELANEDKIFLLNPQDNKYHSFLNYLKKIGAKYKIVGQSLQLNVNQNTDLKHNLEQIIDYLINTPITKIELNLINQKLFELNKNFKLVENLHYVVKGDKVYLNVGLLEDIKRYSSIDSFAEEMKRAYKSFIDKLEGLDGQTRQYFDKLENKEKAIKRYLLLSSLVTNNALQLNMKSIYLHKDNELGGLKGFTKRAGSNITLCEKPSVGKANTLPKSMKIAIIDTQSQLVANVLGQIEQLDIWDGACFENGISNLLARNSYNKHYEGTKKPIGMFVNGLNHTTMKCSTEALTNWRIRMSAHNGTVNLHKLHEKMLGLPIENLPDLTVPYIGAGKNSLLDNQLMYITDAKNQPIYKRIGTEFYEIDGLQYNEDGTYSLFLLNDKDEEITETVTIKSVADLWNLFGAEYSYSLVNGEYVPSEGSLEAVYKYVVNCGYYDEQGNLVQPLKENMIYIAGDKTAFKNGVANLNSEDTLTDDSDLMYFTVTTLDMGVILDYNHSTDNSEISSLSQALMLIAQNEDASERVSEVWNAIGDLMKTNLDLLQLENNASDIKEYLISKIKQDITKSDFGSERYIVELCEELKQNISVSDNNIYGLILKTAFQVINDSALRLKYQGIPGILNPSAKIMQTYRIGNIIYTPQSIVKKGIEITKLFSDQIQTGSLSNENLLTLVTLESTKPVEMPLLDYIVSLSNQGSLQERLTFIQENWDSGVKQVDNLIDVQANRGVLLNTDFMLPLGNTIEIQDNGTVTFYDTVIDSDGKEIYLDSIEKLSAVLNSDKKYRKVLNKASDLKPMNIVWKVNGKTKSIWGHPMIAFLQRITSGNNLSSYDNELKRLLLKHYNITINDNRLLNDSIKKHLLSEFFLKLDEGLELVPVINPDNTLTFQYSNIEPGSYKKTNAEVILPKGFLSKFEIGNKNLNEITREDFDSDLEGQKKWLSFLKIKNLLSVRIPSDGLHSMMSMDIVGTTDDDSNNVGVCIWLLWLLGSDLDIDKAYMLLYQTDDDGIITPWSGLFDYTDEETFNASLDLPLPSDNYKNPLIADDYLDNEFTTLVTNYGLASGVEKIRIAGLILRILSKNDEEQVYLSPKSVLSVWNQGVLDTKLLATEEDVKKTIVDLVKTHNNVAQNQTSISNFITHNLITISADPKCIFHSQSTIDIGMYKRILPKNKLNLVHNDKISYLEFINNNLTGKDGVGIVANATKAFTAITHYIKKYDSKDLLKNLKLKLFKDSSDILTDDKYKEGDYKELGQTALLNASTDNAKELVLQAIKGDKNFLKVITLMNALGFTAEEQVKFTTSEPFVRVYLKTKNINRLLSKEFDNRIKIDNIVKQCIEEDKNNKEIYESIALLYKASEEFSRTAQMLKNGGLKAVNDSELSGILSIFSSSYTNVVLKSLSNLIIEAKNNKKTLLEFLNEKRETDEKIEKFLKLIDDSGIPLEECLKIATNNLDIYRYFNDEVYKKFIIKSYDIFSTFINPYRLLEDLPIYYNMWKNFSDFLNSVSNITKKFKFATDTIPHLITKIRYFDSNYRFLKQRADGDILIPFYLKDRVVTRKARTWYDLKMIYEFIKSGSLGELIFKTDNPTKDISDFMNFITDELIPLLKYNNPNNIFLNNIKVVINQYSNLKTIEFSKKQDPSRNISDVYLWQDILTDFKELGKETYEINDKTYRIDNLLFLYNLISNYNQPGGYRITLIFQDDFYSKIEDPANINLSHDSIGTLWVNFVNEYENNFNLNLNEEDEFNLIAYLANSTKAYKVVKGTGKNVEYYNVKNNNGAETEVYLYPSLTSKKDNKSLKDAVDLNIVPVLDVAPTEEEEISTDLENDNINRVPDDRDNQLLSFEFYIETDLNPISNYEFSQRKYNSNVERRSKLKEIEPFLKQFGIKIKYSEVPGQPDATGALIGDIMYINPKKASDNLEAPMHEWLHFIFGVMKAVDPEFYFDEILDSFKKTNLAKNALNKFTGMSSYSDLADSDLLEEALIRTITGLYLDNIAYDLDNDLEMVRTLRAIKNSLTSLGIMSKRQTLEKFLTGAFNKEAKVFKKRENQTIIRDYCSNSILGLKVANLLRIKLKNGELIETEC